ncbi:hypothetical protein AcW1_003079 [Taiwanofungus camphoratus]|nr:hypothetical protein AcV5_001732 [Antrodia cinnamomea]KAI0933305.1 hypothetical protein AcV7_004812 [Antrodia cinnamomea]KAI0942447.1 hypothetical protein AcW1_003079 [Antrodia cinnamomea]
MVGSPLPCIFLRIEGQEQDSNDEKHWVVGRTLTEATERAAELAGGASSHLNRTRMSSTRGFLLAFGRSLPWGGPTIRPEVLPGFSPGD